MSNKRAAYILLIPGLVFFLLFVGWPLIEVVRLSFFKINFINDKFVGLKNYLKIFSDKTFYTALLNNVFYMVLYTAGVCIVSLSTCFLVFNLPKKWHDLTRFVVYVPVISSGVILSQTWKYIFHINGPINWIIAKLGIKPVAFFQSGVTGIPTISAILTFQIFGIYVIILLANMLSIDKQIFDAAKIDGASNGQINRFIILPLMKKQLGMMILLNVIGSFGVVETVLLLAPYEHTATVTYHIYQTAFVIGKYGYGAAQAILLFIFIIGLTLVKNRVSKEEA